jgi:hypothetical protein
MSQWTPTEATRQAFERATQINVTSDGTTLLQKFINRTVQQLTLREFGLQAVLDRRRGTGNAEYINQRTAGACGGAWVLDTTASSAYDEVGEYAQISFDYKTLVTQGNVTRKIQATGRSYTDILALEMAMKAEDFANAMEKALVLGQGNAAASANIDTTQAINGFMTQIQNAQLINNNTGATPAALNLSNLDRAIDAVKGSGRRSDLVICGSLKGLRSINGALQATQQFVNETEIAAGFRVRTYDGIPIVGSTAIPDTIALNPAGSLIQSYTSGTGTSILVLNKRYAYISELTPMTVMPLAKTESQFDKFDMFWDGALCISNTFGASMLTNVL